jgi:hypothetical protein
MALAAPDGAFREIKRPVLVLSGTKDGSDAAIAIARCERHDALRRQQAGLPGLFAEAAVLPQRPRRQDPASIHEGARDLARDIAAADAYVTSRRERKKIEMLFAHLKRILRLDRLRLRGPNGARDEFHLAATAQNLRKLARLIPVTATWGQHGPHQPCHRKPTTATVNP